MGSEVTAGGNALVPPLPPRRPGARRDRRGRGLRGPLFDVRLPAYRTRADAFDEALLQTVGRIEVRWNRQLGGIEFAVEEIPPSDPAPWEAHRLALGRYFPAQSGLAARIVVYRRPIESRCTSTGEVAALVRDVLVEQVAHVLSRPPHEIDPDYGTET